MLSKHASNVAYNYLSVKSSFSTLDSRYTILQVIAKRWQATSWSLIYRHGVYKYNAHDKNLIFLTTSLKDCSYTIKFNILS